MRQRQDLLVLGDVLPVINEHGLEVIRHIKLDRRSGVECILLEREGVSVILRVLDGTKYNGAVRNASTS